MSSSDASFDWSSDSETAETEVEYDLEVEVMSNASKQKDTSGDDEPEDVYANENKAFIWDSFLYRSKDCPKQEVLKKLRTALF